MSAKTSGEAALKIADHNLTLALTEGAIECVFEDIELSEGEARLQALLTLGDSTRGPWQVDVIRR